MFTILNPTPSSNDTENLQSSKSDITDARFGGSRTVADTSKTEDYTARTGKANTIEENPVDESIKDIDAMTDLMSRKREFSYQEDMMDTQRGNTAEFITKSDYDKLPIEGQDDFEPDPTDPNFLIKKRRHKVRGQFGDGQYDNNPNRGTYEGELR